MQGEPGWHLIPGRLRQAQKSQVGQDWKGGSQRKAGVHPGGGVWEDPLQPPPSSNHALTRPHPLKTTQEGFAPGSSGFRFKVFPHPGRRPNGKAQTPHL